MTGLETTYSSLVKAGVPTTFPDVKLALLTIAVNALMCLAEWDERYERVIGMAVSIAKSPRV